MTTNQPDRLDRIERLLEQSAIDSARQNTESQERLTETEQIARSNARAIQAMLDAQVEDRLERQELRDSIGRLDATILRLDNTIQHISELNEGVVNLLARQEEIQPTILRKLNAIERKVDQILSQDENLSDR